MAERVIFHLNKLIRGKLIEAMRELGQEPEVTVLEGKVKTIAQIAKLIEEARELDPDSPDYAEELADVAQIAKDLIKASGEDIEAIRVKKLDKNGGFSDGRYIGRLALKPGDPWIDYYRNEPEKYPEETV